MKETWRWFGPKDNVTLEDMLQAGVQGVVTGLYDQPPGACWSQSKIAARKTDLAQLASGLPSGLQWDVVESLPVSEEIKTRTGAFEDHLTAYCESMENLATENIKLICYNFMPVLDWTRTDIAHRLPHGGTCMSFDLIDFAMFDIHVLQRKTATLDYMPNVVDAAALRIEQATQADLDTLTQTIIAGLPGAANSLTLEGLRDAIARYNDIDQDQLRQHLKAFLEAVIPTAQRLGIKLCCHPDDPPWAVLGLPRIVSTEDDLAWLVDAVDCKANGLTFCSGSLGSRGDNDLCAIATRFAHRIHFVHLRNVCRHNDIGPTSFFEDTHLSGSTDMIRLLQLFLATHPNVDSLPMRPDHGQDILTDLGKNTAPGYPLCGRMRGLAELRGALLALNATRGAAQV